MTKLMHPGKSAKDGIIIDLHMAGERRIIGKYGMAAHNAIMGNVDIGHDPVIIPQNRFATTMIRSPVDGAILTNDIPVAYFQYVIFVILEFFVLWIIPNRTELEYPVRLADSGRSLDDYLGTYPGIAGYRDIRADD